MDLESIEDRYRYLCSIVKSEHFTKEGLYHYVSMEEHVVMDEVIEEIKETGFDVLELEDLKTKFVGCALDYNFDLASTYYQKFLDEISHFLYLK
jgi:sporulation-control protein spo0M